ncbi:aminotransferase class I/II-fold pyridoxal phosphate-dependent enzyme [Streptomyces sp. VRA16 Mangrove soil]|uniref:aminotransferase class I/II-fold pyridoxal phosphate-dependent enzyme n=1 Tax=Streptomyces sp. VRA16 Mangrove soil TaxID=2817434 RepID=UPI001A9F2447|nr:aminotransferase class I/II-fold pyridoxal phosphate-dependent enzyme [Streptomyces sp. VRA16 Mangrove soil]MBO1335702.1 aminotransferase class I/II-fold pyridoxal phosphate-dependent enzyme [Streptomyces sp. VRA16 Mangrove soil]
MSLDHSRAPVLEAVDAYRRQEMVSFTPPGHKQGAGVDPQVLRLLGQEVFQHDLLASGGLDDRRMRGGFLRDAEQLMADAVHADHTFFTTCGSSLSVKAAMLSVAGPGQRLLISRDAHKSVAAALVLSGIEPVWVEPRWDDERHLAHPPSADDYAAAFERNPQAEGALVTSPTPYGSCADLRTIAEVCHRYGRPLIVDEAWGAHLPFHPDLPTWAMDAGADVCVTSIHKMGSGLEQGSVFHLQGDLVEPSVLKNRADLLGTTSPSVLIYAALDGWRRQMALHGHALMSHARTTADELRHAIEKIDGLHVNDAQDFCGPGRAHDLDPLPVVVDLTGTTLSGYRAADWLREHRRINVHLADHRRINVQITHADSRRTTEPLLDALRDLTDAAQGWDEAPRVEVPAADALRMEQACPPRDAYFAPTQDLPLEKAAGRVAAEMVTPYPPGIPAILPGERLSEPVLTYLRTGVQAGMNLPDAADPTFTTVRVVK